MEQRRKVVIDTDPGQDDVMALILAFGSPLDVMAITTVAGNSSIENVTRNARFLLSYLEIDIPIYSGAATPLKRDLIAATVHGESGLAGVDPTNAPDLTGDAVDQILRLVRENPNEITIVALGPLTNIALALQREPETMALVDRLVIMGGAIAFPGNKNRVAEFNIFIDPEAADVVFRSDIPRLIVPLDACDEMFVYAEDFARITSPEMNELLDKMLSEFMVSMEKEVGVKAALMWDPLTVFALLHPEHCTIEKYNIEIETKGELTRGMTVADRRRKSTAPANTDVAMRIDREAFVDAFVAAASAL